MFRRVLNRRSDTGDERPQTKRVSKLGIEKPSRPSDSTVPPPTHRTLSDRINGRKRGRRPGRQQPLASHLSDSASLTRNSHISGGRSVYSTAESLLSMQSTITVETTRTSYNENRKPIPTFNQQSNETTGKHSHQLFCNPMNCMRNLLQANNDIVVTHLYLKDITIKRDICAAFLALIRGDNKSWESMAVDILRQKARWESITFEECQNPEKPVKIKRPSRIVLPQTHQQEQYMETCISFILSIDNCAHLHLSNLYLEQPFTLQTLAFSKNLVKLQFDLMDLSQTISTLCHCLPQNRSLEILIASRCGLNDQQLAGLLGSLPDQLLEVRVFGNKCRTQGLAAAAIMLQEHTHLQILDLSYQHLPRKPIQNGGDQTAESQINEEDLFDISWLMAALMSNKTLLTLDLDNTAIDDNDLRHIINALCENTTLENIMLNHNFITNDGVSALAARFHEMSGLKKISMYSNLFDAPTMAPPPTEITTPSVTSSATQKQRNANGQNGTNNPTISIPNDDSYEDEDDDDDRTINTAVSSLADETVFQQMESNPTMLPAQDTEVPQEPFQFPRADDGQVYGDKVEGEQHYFDDGQDYDESVAPTEYEEVSVYTEVEEGHDASYTYGEPMEADDDGDGEDSVPPYNPDATMATQSIADAGGFVSNNTTSF